MAFLGRGTGAHFFEGSSNVVVNGGTMNATVNIHNEPDALRILEAVVAPNAILNAGGRADPVGCFAGTRERLIRKVEDWMESGYREDRRILWLSGPAGAGKSAIVQTVAENCVRRKAPMANFFFFRADGSRNSSYPVVATLLHQLLMLIPDLSSSVEDVIRQDRLILNKPLRHQFAALLNVAVRATQRDLPPNQSPIVLLIDGLDECDSLPQSTKLDSAAKSEQNTLLYVLHDLVTSSDSPFIALVASRAESHIEMAFNRIGCGKDSIHLASDDQADQDIRRYVVSELSRIKLTHPLGRRLPAEWPSESIIDTIVSKSSGQFIYPSTIIRFIGDSSQSPSISLAMVLEVRPAESRSPFSDLDAMYSFILSRCQQWGKVREILAVNDVYPAGARAQFKGLEQEPMKVLALLVLPWVSVRIPDGGIPLSAFGYSSEEILSFFSDLTSIIDATVTFRGLVLRFYHASFQDFCRDQGRSGRFWIYSQESDTPTRALVAPIIRRMSRKPLDGVEKYFLDEMRKLYTHSGHMGLVLPKGKARGVSR